MEENEWKGWKDGRRISRFFLKRRLGVAQRNGWWERHRMEKYFFRNMETGISLVAYLAFLPGLELRQPNMILRIPCISFVPRSRRKHGSPENHDFNCERGERGILHRFLSNSRILFKKKMWFFLSRKQRFKNSREREEIDLPMIIRKFCYRKNYI